MQNISPFRKDFRWTPKYAPLWHREFMDLLGKQLGFKTMEDWYKLSNHDMVNKGGNFLIKKYGNSASKVLQGVYPWHRWSLSRFEHAPRGYWNPVQNREEISKFILWLGSEMKVMEPKDWYRVSFGDIQKLVSSKAFRKVPLEKMLMETYPDHPWDIAKLQFRKEIIKASQRKVVLAIRELFPHSEVLENHLVQETKRMNKTPLELDIYVPNLKLAFEFQGMQHYFDVYGQGQKWNQFQRDLEKREICQEYGITLIEVPYWWDYKNNTLIGTISDQRPDLIYMPGNREVIPNSPPGGFPNEHEIHELMHGKSWDGRQNLKGWWISEKMDGVRAYWSGKGLKSRRWREINCPNWFTLEFPKDTPLDGELWMGRGSFESTVEALKSNEDAFWKNMKYVIFDLPEPNLRYESRMEKLQTMKFPAHALVIQNNLCEGNEHLVESLKEIVQGGGEGLVVIKPQSLYVPERSNCVLKVKVKVEHHLLNASQMHDECEVQLMEVVTGGLFCRQGNRIETLIGCDPQIVNSPPPLGTIITIKHVGKYQNGRLRHPFYWRERQDLTWEDILDDQQMTVCFLPLVKLQVSEPLELTCRSLLEEVQQKLCLKSLEELYTVPIDAIRNHSGGKSLLDDNFHGSLAKLLTQAYPDVTWYPWKLQQPVPQGYWELKDNQKLFMDWLGNELQFKSMQDYYKLRAEDVRTKGGRRLLDKYNSSPSQIVLAVYPQHNWDLSKFSRRTRQSVQSF